MLLGVGSVLALVWLVLVAALWTARPDREAVREALRLLPDVLPVIGYADDALLVAWTLRAVARRAGDEAVARHWPGTPDGLAAVRRVARMSS